jgi:hypothetical protein
MLGSPALTAGVVAILLSTACAGRAAAAPITSAADPALQNAVVVDFESLPPGTYPAFAGGVSVQTTAGVVNVTGPRVQVTSTYTGQYNTTGQYLSSEGYLFRNLIVTFPVPVRAFGFNVGLTSQPWELHAYDAAGNEIEMVTIPPTLGSNAGDFVGIASSTDITDAVFVVQLPLHAGPLWAVIDNLAFRAVATEPAASADLRLDAKQVTARARAGHPVTYRLTTENRGPAAADATVLTIALDGVAVTAIAAPGACTIGDGTVTCAIGNLAPARRKKIKLRVTPSAPATLTLRASATSAASDPTPSDAVATLATGVR